MKSFSGHSFNIDTGTCRKCGSTVPEAKADDRPCTPPPSPGHCYWAYLEDGTACFIPQCYGAIHDPAGCTCSVPGSEIERLRATLEIYKRRNRHFEMARGRNQQLREKYWRKIADLERQVRELKSCNAINIEN